MGGWEANKTQAAAIEPVILERAKRILCVYLKHKLARGYGVLKGLGIWYKQ